jgi:opacity protein-like surface antigen
MKKFVVLPLLLLVFGATAAFAQMEAAGPTWMLEGNIGYGLPMGDFKDGFDGAVAAGASGCYMFTGKYGLELGAEWVKFPTKASSDFTFQFIPVMADFVANFPMSAPVVPYLKGGLGVYFETAEVKIGSVKVSESTNDFGFNLGGGVKFPLSETTVIDIGARFHNVMTEDESTQYFTVGAGIGFMF